MTKFKDFYDMPIPQAALDMGFVDMSWHNDAGPRMIHASQLDTDEHGEVPVLTFMCGGEHQARELNEGYGYLVYWAVYGCEHADERLTWHGDSLDDALVVLALQRDLLLAEQAGL